MNNSVITKVKATGTINSKSKKDPSDAKQTEISINFKQPIRISRPGIDQPKIKVANAPRIVHIIQRKAPNRAEQPKSQHSYGRVHVIQASNAKKGWKFNMDDESSESHQQAQKVQEVPSQLSSVKIEEKQLVQEIVPQNVALDELQESLTYTQNKKIHQRKLEHAEIISIVSGSKKSQQSIMEQSSAHHIEVNQQKSNNFEKIDVESIEQIFRQTNRQNLNRKLIYKENYFNENEEKIKNMVHFEQNQPIQIYQIIEESNCSNGSIKLRRNLQLQKRIVYEQSEIQGESHRSSVILVQNDQGKFKQILISEDIQEKIRQNVVKHQKRTFWLLQKTQKIDEKPKIYSNITISQDQQNFSLSNKVKKQIRFMNHIMQVQNEEKQFKMYSIPIEDQIQNIEIKSVSQEMKNAPKSSKLYRKLLVSQNNQEEMKVQILQQPYQKINIQFIEQQRLNQLKSFKLCRSLQTAKNVEKDSFIVPPKEAPLSEPIQISQISEEISQKSNKPKQMRNLLLIERQKNRIWTQQIIIPQQISIQMNDSTQSVQHHKRNIKNVQIQDQKIDLKIGRNCPIIPEEPKVEKLDSKSQQFLPNQKQRQLLKQQFHVKPIQKPLVSVKSIKKFRRPIVQE